MSGSWGVEVEVFALRVMDDDGRPALGRRSARAPAPTGVDLDELSLLLAGARSLVPGTVNHSTSWRREGSALVVTYAVLPDPRPDLPVEPLRQPSVVAGSTALRPTPDVLHAHHIAAHAVRHLADLAERDAVITGAAALHPQLWDLVRQLAAHMPTGAHAEVHARASALRGLGAP